METLALSRTCPKCRFEQPEGEQACRRCALVFSKYRSPRARTPVPTASNSAKWVQSAKRWLLDSDESQEGVSLAGRGVVYLLLLWWGWGLMRAPIESSYAGESFLHLINLPFHEAGHLLFMPFGRFMMFLGGTVGQILMPIVCLLTFLIKTRDPFGASVALWWTAENFIDIAPYINDARTLDLLLLGGVTGKETDGHDWENILSMLGWLSYDHRIAQASQRVGTVLMLLSFVWGAVLLYRHERRLK